jgi:hypothetical protein
MKWIRVKSGEYVSDLGWRISRRTENYGLDQEADYWNVFAPGDPYGDGDLGEESYCTLREAKDAAEECYWRDHFDQAVKPDRRPPAT